MSAGAGASNNVFGLGSTLSGGAAGGGAAGGSDGGHTGTIAQPKESVRPLLTVCVVFADC